MDICVVDKELKDEPGILGIDAGGTFTDLAFLSGEKLHVVAKVKTPTLHNDMAYTIEHGIEKISSIVDKKNIKTINIATTLATNAIVEHKIRKAALILLGYDKTIVESAKARDEFGTDLVYVVDGGHDIRGNEKKPLDEDAIRKIIDSVKDVAEGIAVSGFFSVRNPEHEKRVVEIVKEMAPDLFVTCGYELATDLDAIKRATTVSLNAGLIPIVMDLIQSVERVCMEIGIDASIMVVRGDGSLVSQTWAMNHPIEMVLSGPAASASGAFYLAEANQYEHGSWVADIGGTTTDIIYLHQDGKPGVSKNGAIVGGHKTLVKAIDIYTFGLGGDSRVAFDREKKMTIGPRRVKSLCSAAVEFPELVAQLRQLNNGDTWMEPLIVIKGREAAPSSKFEERIQKKLENGPCLAELLLQEEGNSKAAMSYLDDMETAGLVDYAGFTPTDALHILVRLDFWDKEASCLAARLMIRDTNESLESFAARVCENTVNKIVFNVYRKSLLTGGFPMEEDGEAEKMLYHFLAHKRIGQSGMKLDLGIPIIGIGAPSWAFMKETGDKLGQDSLLPQGAEVAGAVGAAVGSFSLQYAVTIEPSKEGTLRVHLPMGNQDYDDLEAAVKEANQTMIPWIQERARRAGAKKPLVACKREDEEAFINGGLQRVYLETKLYFEVTDAS